jgi:hypothetical protein
MSPELREALHVAAVPAAAILIERQRPFQPDFDHFAFVQRPIALGLDKGKVNEDAAWCLGRVRDTPAFFVVPVSYHGAGHEQNRTVRAMGRGLRQCSGMSPET